MSKTLVNKTLLRVGSKIWWDGTGKTTTPTATMKTATKITFNFTSHGPK